MTTVAAPTMQLLEWVAERPRTYRETIEAWKSSCPRLTVWEDALADELVRIEQGQVLVTAAGRDLLADFLDAAPGRFPQLASDPTGSTSRMRMTA